jgi:type II secretory pathway pseudopilin PulG
MFIAMVSAGGKKRMRTKYFKRILGGLILGLSLLGIGAVSSTTTQAQYPWPTQDQIRQRERERQRELRRQREQQARQGGYYDQYGNYHPATAQNGWYDQNGVFHPNANQNGYYNRNSNGYYNNRRSGRFNDGYPDLGGSFDFRQTALNAGFNDGTKAGREDRRRGRYNLQGHSEYQKATRDYNSGRGDRYLYQQYYRVAFEHGYADGYSGY